MIYYYSKCWSDSDAYTIREKRKKDVVSRLKNLGFEKNEHGVWERHDQIGYSTYGPVQKAKVDLSKFELMRRALGESRGAWEDHSDQYFNRHSTGGV